MIYSKHINIPPYAPILMESTRAIGYSLETAIADIIDNSIAAEASSIQIEFFPVDKEYISILDDGIGMNSDELTIAMQYGSKNPNESRQKKDLGRFGLGLKTASLSQCKMLTVISKQEGIVEGRRWDLDYVASTGEWSLAILEEEEMSKMPQFDKLCKQSHGTLVVWQNLDRLKIGEGQFELSMGRKMDDVREHLSLVYHRFLEGEPGIKKLSIAINNEIVVPYDPFLKAKSQKGMDAESLNINGERVVVQPYILPHPDKISADEAKLLAGREGLRKRQGFYIYRNKRLLVWGTWFKMIRQGDQTKLVRIQVDIPNALDYLWTLDIKKSSAIPPDEVKKNLKNIIEKMAEKSKRTWTVRSKKETNDTIEHVWNRMRTSSGGYIYRVNREHPVFVEYMSAQPDSGKEMEKLLQYIELDLPLNALYLDLTNDEKIENDQEHNLQDLISAVESMLNNVAVSDQEILLERILQSEPFSDYREEINHSLGRKQK